MSELPLPISNSSSQDNDLEFLDDSVFSSLFDESSSSNILKDKWGTDGLFMERLESFIEGQLRDIRNFANKEQIPIDEIRKLVAIPHAKYMLSLDLTFPSINEPALSNEKKPITSLYTVKSTLTRLSNVLQLMYTAAGLDSLLLVVSPHAIQSQSQSKSTTEASWIGGTEVGKEFWMSLKGGGVNGARAFRLRSQKRYQEELPESNINNDVGSFVDIPKSATSTSSTPSSIVSLTSRDIKTELNAAMRQALRASCGNPSAEMRWTKPASLEELYGVRLVGWPSSVKTRNPSNNSAQENRLLLDLLRSRRMKFVPAEPPAEQRNPSTSLASATPTWKNTESEEINESNSDFGELFSSDTPANHSRESEFDTRPQKRTRQTE